MNTRISGHTASSRKQEQTVRDLLKSSAEQLFISPAKACELAAAAHERSLASGNATDTGKSLHALGLALTFLGEYDNALARLEESRALFMAKGEELELARVLNSIGNALHRTGDVVGALRRYKEGAALVGDGDHEMLGKIQCNIALIYTGLGDYQEASNILLGLLPLYHDSSDMQGAVILDNLGGLYADLGEFEQSRKYLLQSLERSRLNGYLYGQAMTLGNLGAICNETGKYQEALACLTESLAICEQIPDHDGRTRTLHNIGVCYELQGNYTQALRYLRRSAKEAAALGNRRSQGYTLASVGGILRKTGKPEEAIRSLEKALNIAEELGEKSLQHNIHQELSHAYENAGDLAKALHAHRTYAEMREETRSEETRRSIAEMQARFDLERAEKEKEIYRLRSEQLEKDLRIRTGELTAMALRLVQRSEMIDSVKEGIVEVLRAQNGSAHPTLRSVLHTVEGESRVDDGWLSFEQQFHRVHPDYIRILSAQYPAFSPTELKICALLKTNLNSKEIARLLHVSLRDIENHRYRIRKKLGLGSGENLASFLAGR